MEETDAIYPFFSLQTINAGPGTGIPRSEPQRVVLNMLLCVSISIVLT